MVFGCFECWAFTSSQLFMLGESSGEGEHHFADVTLNGLLFVAEHVKVEQALLLEMFATLLASVYDTRVVIEYFV